MNAVQKFLLKTSTAALVAAGLVAGSTVANAMGVPAGANILNQWNLFDHPDGGEAPPTYGLRLDGLISGSSGDEWTFSFQDTPGDGRNAVDIGTSTVIMTLFEVGGVQNININGTVFGGRRKHGSNGTDATDVFGNAGADGWVDAFAGTWGLDFTYRANVTSTANDIPLRVTADNSLLNTGTLTSIDVASVVAGSVFNLEDEAGRHPYSFRYEDNNHRCGGHADVLCADRAVGNGWLNHSVTPGTDPNPHIYSSDFLFTGVQVVPLPAALPLMITGLGAFGLLSWRRKKASA